MQNLRFIKDLLIGGAALVVHQISSGLIEKGHRDILPLDYDQPLASHRPQGFYANCHVKDPEMCGMNTALRPAFLDGGFDFKDLISPYTDLGAGISDGAFIDRYHQVRRGQYLLGEGFAGCGGGTALSIYQLLNPGRLTPPNVVIRRRIRYATFDQADKTDETFVLSDDRVTSFARASLGLAVKEPLLYPGFSLEVSMWFERQWRGGHSSHDCRGDCEVEATADLYCFFSGLNYAWPSTGRPVSVAVTAGGPSGSDRHSAWRISGGLPLVSASLWVLPGYYYQEFTAMRVLHRYGNCMISLDEAHRFQFRADAACSHLDYLPGFEQLADWQTGVSSDRTFTPGEIVCRIVACSGYGLNALRHSREGAHSVGLLIQ